MRTVLLLAALLALTRALAMTDDELITNITKTLDSHLLEGSKWGMNYHFYRPGLVKYGPDQWLWDSCFHMIAWSRINVTNSVLDLRTMLQMQKPTGEVPEMIMWGHQGKKDKILNKLLQSDPKTTDISQMPMLAFALRRIYETTKNLTLLK
jgi:hypothetical protein